MYQCAQQFSVALSLSLSLSFSLTTTTDLSAGMLDIPAEPQVFEVGLVIQLERFHAGENITLQWQMGCVKGMWPRKQTNQASMTTQNTG